MQRIITSLTVILLLCTVQLFAQKFNVGVFLGGSNYQGDVVESHLRINETQPAFGGFVRYRLTSKFDLKGNIYFGTLSGTDRNFKSRASRGFSFRTSIMEGGVNVEWNILGKNGYNQRSVYAPMRTPYIYTGIGAVTFQPNPTGLPLDSPDLVADYKKFQFMIPIGIGYKYDFTEKVQFCVEVASHIPFTDYLDGVSFEGRSNNNDWYVFGGVGVSYLFGAPRYKKGIDIIGMFR